MRGIRLKNNFLNTSQRNLPPLTEFIKKTIERKASFVILSAEENWRQASNL